MRFYKKDPDELSFIDYYDGSKEAEEILGEKAQLDKKIGANLYFIKGNHEDFEYLESLPQFDDMPTSVDAYYKIFYLGNGSVHNISVGHNQLKVASLGGVSDNHQWGKSSLSKHYTKSEYQQLCAYGQEVNLFLSHDVPYGTIYENSGSKDVLNFITMYQPKLHFCGHYHEAGQQLSVSENTESYILNEVNFRKPSKLNPGCIAIVEFEGKGEYKVFILDELWLGEYRKENFRYI